MKPPTPSAELVLRPDKANIKPAGRFMTKVLDLFGFDAITIPPRSIYIRPHLIEDAPLLRHELAHVAQIDRDGHLTFWPKICFDYFWHGYQNSPYEIEARKYER